MKKDLQKMNMLLTLIFWVLLCAGCILCMFYTAGHKTIVIPDVQSTERGMIAKENLQDGGAERYPLSFQKEAGISGIFHIPLEKEIQAEDVVIENRYRDQELWIYIQDGEEDFYRENAVSGDITSIISGYLETQKDGVILKLQMKEVLEYRTVMENNTMIVTYEPPRAVYDHIIVVDPAGGGEETGVMMRGYAEKTLTLKIAQCLPQKLADQNIRIYFTRQEDVAVTKEERLALIDQVDADIFIRISAGADEEDTSRYGISAFYNESYYIPEFGNVQLADVLTRSVTVATSNRAEGVFPAGKDSILQEISIPAAQINVGYLTHAKEGELLGEAEYREKLAQGIADAITEVYANEQ